MSSTLSKNEFQIFTYRIFKYSHIQISHIKAFWCCPVLLCFFIFPKKGFFGIIDCSFNLKYRKRYLAKVKPFGLLFSIRLSFYEKFFHLVYGQCDTPLKITGWTSGQIKSPGYPSYSGGLECKWVIKVSLGNRIKISFSDFEVSTVS